MVIMWPMKSEPSKSYIKIIIILTWIVSVIFATPLAIAHKAVEVNDDGLKQCRPDNMDPSTLLWYRNLICLVQYFIPCTLIGGIYVRIAIALWKSDDKMNGQDMLVVTDKKSVTKMMMIVIALFTIAWFPFQLYHVLSQVYPQINYYHYINLIWFCCHLLAMSHSCCNPFIYVLWNEKFKKELRLRLECCFGKTHVLSKNESLGYSTTDLVMTTVS